MHQPPDTPERWAALESAARLILSDPAACRVLDYRTLPDLRGLIAYASRAGHNARRQTDAENS